MIEKPARLLGGYSVTFYTRYIRFNAHFYMVLYIYIYENSADTTY